MQITELTSGRQTFRVYATIEGERFEFTSFRYGAVEVYKFKDARAWAPAFVGYLPDVAARKLRAILCRDIEAVRRALASCPDVQTAQYWADRERASDSAVVQELGRVFGAQPPGVTSVRVFSYAIGD